MWCIRQATDYKDCLNQVRQFTQKEFAAGTITHVSGSVGRVHGASASENSAAETWTLTCTTGGADGTAVFSVSGSVSGAQTAATAGEPYSIDEVSFVITAEGGSFTATDQFTFPIASSTAEWVQDDYFTNYNNTGESWLVQHGIGAGSDEIYGSWWTVSNGSTYWNMGVSGLTGYNDGYADGSTDTTFGITAQPGYAPYYDCLNNSGFTFTCIATSRHVKIIPTLGVPAAIQGSSYVGWFLPHATPSQWDYPMFCGGSTDDEAQLAGGGEDDHTCYWNGYDDEYSGAVLDVTIWREITKFSPQHYGDFEDFRSFLNQDMPLYPCVPIHEGSNNVYGELEGVYYPAPYTYDGASQALLLPGDVVVTDDAVAVCYQDVTGGRGAGSLVAMDLMGD